MAMSSAVCSNRWIPLFEDRWIVQIREALDEMDAAEGLAVSIFNVPELLRNGNPLAYSPQIIALGPYHHWRPDLYEMERYKLSAARRVQGRMPLGRFEEIVKEFTRVAGKARAHYHRYLDFNDETLSWMMAVDACFLLEFLEKYRGNEATPATGRRSSFKLLGYAEGQRSTNENLVRDIMMLENQVPLFLLTEILKLLPPPSPSTTSPITAAADDTTAILETMLTAFMKDLTPFKSTTVFPAVDITTIERSHLLEVLYHVVVPVAIARSDTGVSIRYRNGETMGFGSQPSYVTDLLKGLYDTLNIEPVRRFLRPVIVAIRLPWGFLGTAFPGRSTPKEHEDDERDGGNDDAKPPLVDQILIPSVSELIDVGVRFRPTNGGITTTSFDTKTATFSIPVVTLDTATESVLRNLVAYEASALCGPLVLARYTELMNGIIDTPEDVRLLRRDGVIVSHLKSDEDAAGLWNGMAKSVRLTKVPFMDKVVEDVNVYYNGKWKVKSRRLFRTYVLESWRLLTLLAAVLLLLLNGLQAFCSVYTCARWVNVTPTTTS